jgi:hypothetical protein
MISNEDEEVFSKRQCENESRMNSHTAATSVINERAMSIMSIIIMDNGK